MKKGRSLDGHKNGVATRLRPGTAKNKKGGGEGKRAQKKAGQKVRQERSAPPVS